MTKKQHGLRLDTELVEAGKKKAEKEGRSFNNWVEYLIKKALGFKK